MIHDGKGRTVEMCELFTGFQITLIHWPEQVASSYLKEKKNEGMPFHIEPEGREPERFGEQNE